MHAHLHTHTVCSSIILKVFSSFEHRLSAFLLPSPLPNPLLLASRPREEGVWLGSEIQVTTLIIFPLSCAEPKLNVREGRDQDKEKIPIQSAAM